MEPTKRLPPTFLPGPTLDLSSRRLLLVMNLVGLLLLPLFGWLFLLATAALRPELDSLTLEPVVFGLDLVSVLLALLLVMVLHELVHGFFFWLFTRERPEFGFKLLYAYAAAPGWYFPRWQFVIVGLAPLVLLSLGGLLLIAVLPFHWMPVIYLAIVTNAAGAVGDLAVVAWLFNRPAHTYVQDEGPRMTLYFASSEYVDPNWLALMDRLGVPAGPATAAFHTLVGYYQEGERDYHNLSHVRQVLAQVDELADHATDPDIVRLAAWFHDAIYDPLASDNELRSAECATEMLSELGLPPEIVAEVARLIRLTAGYSLPTWQQASPDDANAHVLLDADLAGLSISAAEFDHYADHIRREFAAVPDEQFRTGRLAFLQRLLERERIYYTPQMLACCEAAARKNIQREMARMR